LPNSWVNSGSQTLSKFRILHSLSLSIGRLAENVRRMITNVKTMITFDWFCVQWCQFCLPVDHVVLFSGHSCNWNVIRRPLKSSGHSCNCGHPLPAHFDTVSDSSSSFFVFTLPRSHLIGLGFSSHRDLMAFIIVLIVVTPGLRRLHSLRRVFFM